MHDFQILWKELNLHFDGTRPCNMVHVVAHSFGSILQNFDIKSFDMQITSRSKVWIACMGITKKCMIVMLLYSNN